MNRSRRPFSLASLAAVALAFAATLTTLAGIDRLAQPDAGSAKMAQVAARQG